MTPPKNIPASVRQRLLNRGKRDRRPFNELLQYYSMERFLYRLSQSVHWDQFILKGALMLRVWRSPELRPTMDIDMLGITSNQEADIVAQVQDILTVEVEADGLAFDPASIQAERITEDADYESFIQSRKNGFSKVGENGNFCHPGPLCKPRGAAGRWWPPRGSGWGRRRALRGHPGQGLELRSKDSNSDKKIARCFLADAGRRGWQFRKIAQVFDALPPGEYPVDRVEGVDSRCDVIGPY